ncbi:MULTISPECIES: type IV pilin protein [unclassified Moraxella]|uniref:type IV pilin protein n=1 Tax=unclassified Moraxella TaxID=2685852 RepID=UPI003AF61309
MVTTQNTQQGFNLIELMIVIAIIAILAAVALPSYQRYIINARRADMMAELGNIATRIESRKLVEGVYTNIPLQRVLGGTVNGGVMAYPNGTPSYDVKIVNVGDSPNSDMTATNMTSARWKVQATPRANTVLSSDGVLSVDYTGLKCRVITKPNNTVDKKCGRNDEWR